MLRFRQVVVNIVLATDIFDKELNDLRKSRWTKAFSEEANNKHLRATIVIENSKLRSLAGSAIVMPVNSTTIIALLNRN